MAIKGLKGVLSNLSKFGAEAEKSVEVITFARAKGIELMAKQLAPVDMGFLRNQIHTEEVSKLDYKIIAGASYSAYMEFGTGGLVNVPKELKEIAIQFKGNGVRQVNIEPQPFMYPAWKKGQTQYIKDLKKELEILTKKYK